MVWPKGAILKIEASRLSKIALEIDFSYKKRSDIEEKILKFNFLKDHFAITPPFWLLRHCSDNLLFVLIQYHHLLVR